MGFGLNTVEKYTGRTLRKAFEDPAPSWVRWRDRGNRKSPTVKIPDDDPWTYKKYSDYVMFRGWKDFDPRPTTTHDMRESVKELRYTDAARNEVLRRNARVTTAGMQQRNIIDQEKYEIQKTKFDVRRPLGLLQRQRAMENDEKLDLKERDPDVFLSPNLIQRNVRDNTSTSSKDRMNAMIKFRKLKPSLKFTVPKTAIMHSGYLESPSQSFLSLSDSEPITFDMFVNELVPPSSYYKIGSQMISSEHQHTSSSYYSNGYAHTGITGYAQGCLGTGN